MRKKLNRNSVEHTLIIPLWTRALAEKKLPGLLPDHDAKMILRALGKKRPPHPLYYMQCASLTGAIRQYDLACEIKSYLANHPRATIVELGAGLSCLRRQMKIENNAWINLDLPDVIRMRNAYIPAGKNERNIACDLTSPVWLDGIPFDASKGIILLAAGVLQYFTNETVRRLVCNMAERFPGGAFVFDIVTSKGLRNGNTTVKSAGNATRLLFSMNDAQAEMSRWSSRLINITQKDYYTGYSLPPGNYSWFTRQYIKSKRNQLAVVHVEFAE